MDQGTDILGHEPRQGLLHTLLATALMAILASASTPNSSDVVPFVVQQVIVGILVVQFLAMIIWGQQEN